nr:copia protein [Tanacetum cinerariifolium]
MTSFGYRLNPRYAIKECSSCGTLYTRDCTYLKGNVEDKILVPKPSTNCARYARCGHPVDGLYRQGCTFLQKKLKEDLVTYFQGFQNTSESSDDSTNIVNIPLEPFVVKQDHGSFVDKIICGLNKDPGSHHLHTFSPNQFHCFYCKDALGDDYTIAITPVLSIEEPDNSLSMRDEHLDTIPATKSDESGEGDGESWVRWRVAGRVGCGNMVSAVGGPILIRRPPIFALGPPEIWGPPSAMGTTNLGLWYPKGTSIETIVYADSDHAAYFVDRKSTSGICTFVGGCLTSWFSRKQTALAISTTKAEYVSTEKACQQALWMKQALIDYDVRLDDIPIMCDNKGATDLSKNPVQHSRNKHIKIRHHFLYDNVKKGHISIEKVPSVDNIADILMKPLKRKSFNYLCLGLGMMEHIS